MNKIKSKEMSAKDFLTAQNEMCGISGKDWQQTCRRCELFDLPYQMCRMDEITYGKDSVDADVIDSVIAAVQRWIDNRSEKDKRMV